MVLIFTIVAPALPVLAHEPCNRYHYYGMPNTNEYPDGWQYVCKHDLDNNDDQCHEYYTSIAGNMDGHLFQHQDQYRINSLFPRFYYGLIDPNNYWQWQKTERFEPDPPENCNSEEYSNGGITKRHEFALHHTNGAWQHEYAWRVNKDGYLNYCYAQSDYDENGDYRAGSYFCNIKYYSWSSVVQVSGDSSPVPLRNPSFRWPDW